MEVKNRYYNVLKEKTLFFALSTVGFRVYLTATGFALSCFTE